MSCLFNRQLGASGCKCLTCTLGGSMDSPFIAKSIHFRRSPSAAAHASTDAIGSTIGTEDLQHCCYC